MFKHKIYDDFSKALENIEFGEVLVEFPDGRRRLFSGKRSGSSGHIRLHSWNVLVTFSAKGDIGLAETYCEGLWESDNLCELLRVGLQNEEALYSYIHGNVFTRAFTRLKYLFSLNTLKGSSKNIKAHYDLGNDFYRLWLDPGMSYSSALFKEPGESLHKAQFNKYDRALDLLQASSGRLLEIGCGWGAFLERALERCDYDAKGITLSQDQYLYSRRRLLGGKGAEIALEDYRVQQGVYDHIVSIEMFEAVGQNYWSVFFRKLNALLASNGRAVIQTITIGDDYFGRYRKSGDMLRSFIFPGGMLPSPSAFRREAEAAGLKIAGTFAFGKDYAETLGRWLHAFESHAEEVRRLGFDERFIRMWRFYLACCMAAFSVGRTDVIQWELQHA